MSPRKDDIKELGWAFYGLVAGVVLLVGVVQLIEQEHHTVNYWLVVGSWLVTFAALSWGFRRRRSMGPDGQRAHQLPPLGPGHRESGEETDHQGKTRKWTRSVLPDGGSEPPGKGR